eukprot:1162062-Pelagomonas_calceolata.AAC.16
MAGGRDSPLTGALTCSLIDHSFGAMTLSHLLRAKNCPRMLASAGPKQRPRTVFKPLQAGKKNMSSEHGAY